jgi:hypothetical protein
MRLAFVALVFVAVVFVALGAACNRDPLPAPATGTSARPDLAAPALKCADIQSCVAKCPLGDALPPCAAACEARLTVEARGFYDALQACMVPSCVANRGPCNDPGALGCKMCAMSRCAAQASSCLLH